MQQNLIRAIYNKEKIIINNAKLIDALQLYQIPIIFTEQYQRFLGATIDVLKTRVSEHTPIAKMAFNCCLESDFLKFLENTSCKQFILAGIETHICVLQTAIALKNLGYRVYLAADSCGSRNEHDHNTALELMRQAGVIICSTEIIIFQLLQSAQSKEYRKVLKIIRDIEGRNYELRTHRKR